MQLLRRRQTRSGSFLQHVATFGAAAALLWACDTYTPDLLEGERRDPLDNETDATDPDDEPTPATGSSPSVTPTAPASSSMGVPEPDPNPGAVGGGGNSGNGGTQGSGAVGNGGSGNNSPIPPVGTGGTAPTGTGGTAPMPSGSAGSTVVTPPGGGGSTPEPMPTVVVPMENPLLIDDFEDGNEAIPTTDGRVGYWFTSGAPDAGTITPFAVVPLSPVNPNNAASTSGIHITASGFAAGSYALVGVEFNATEAYAMAANYSGIMFWARANSATDNIITVKLPTTATDPDDDHFGVNVTLTEEWSLNLIPYDLPALRQQGFGAAQVFNPAELIGIQFSLASGRTGFDVWIDDVTFAE